MQYTIPEFSQTRQKYQMQSVTIGEFRPFYLAIENNKLLSKNSIFCGQVFVSAHEIKHSTSDKNGRFWFGELLDDFFDAIEERYTGVDDSRKHDELNSILVG